MTSSASSTRQVAVSGGVAVLELREATTPAEISAGELVAGLRTATGDPAVRALLLLGVGGPDAVTTPTAVARLGEAVNLLRRVALPVVVAAEGPCEGVEVLLVAAADLVLAADTASFAVPAGSLDDALADGRGALLVDRLGVGRANELCLLGDIVTAAEAQRWGLVNRVHPLAQVRAAATALAEQLAAGPTVAIAGTKQALASAAARGPAVDREGGAEDR